MARVSNSSTIRRTPIDEGTTSYNPRDNAVLSPHSDVTFSGNVASATDQLRDRIINSSIYQQAYSLFNRSSVDSIWLQRLRAIPQSVVVGHETWLDQLGLSNKYNDKLQALEAEAYNQIQKLISEYQTYVQELPTTQVQDFADAGINSAITGQGINGASITGEASQRDLSPYQMESANPLESISTIGNLVFSATDGILSAIKTFNQIGLSKRQNFTSLVKELMGLGFRTFPFDSSFKSFDHWWENAGSSEARKLNLGFASSSMLRSQLEYFSSAEASNRLIDYDDDGVDFLSEAGQSLVNSLIDHELDTWKYQFEYKRAKARYDSLYQLSLDPNEMAKYYQDKTKYDSEIVKARSSMESSQASLLKAKLDAIQEWYDKAGTDPQARAILARVLMQINPTEFIMLENYDDSERTALASQYLGLLGSAVGAVSNIPFL